MTDDEKAFVDHLLEGVVIIGTTLFKAKKPEHLLVLSTIVEEMIERWASQQTQEYYNTKLTEVSNDGRGWRTIMASNFPRDDHPELYDILDSMEE